MAGAVSAGAYTAGAIDYLIEALDEWQRRKESNDPSIPRHQVEISVIGGASAGGMTGVIAAAALQDPIAPVASLGTDIMAQQPGNKFYHSWVDLVGDDMLGVLLDPGDLGGNGLQSALNSDFIEKVADRAVRVSGEPPVARKYVSNHLKLFVTLSNLEGMDFAVAFRANSKINRYVVNSHNDYACFKLCNNLGDYGHDGWIPLNFKSLLNVDMVKDAAMATGAFPVGLKARVLNRDVRYMNDLEWFHHITRDAGNPFKGDTYQTVNVDGGMINNEPFDKVRELLMAETGQCAPLEFQDYNKFKSTVLMIDPFPSEPSSFNRSTGLFTILGNTLGAMVNQARIKPSVLIEAMDSSNAGQYLIAPVRYESSGGSERSIEGSKAIACGSLGGFGGFVSKEFRIHDYFLGRANCEKFLRDHFTVPFDSTNPIFVDGYAQVADKQRYRSQTDGGLQIIPLFSERSSRLNMPVFSNNGEWPTVTQAYVNAYRKRIKVRAEKLLFNLAQYNTTQRALLWLAAKVILNGKIADVVMDNMVKALADHHSIKK